MSVQTRITRFLERPAVRNGILVVILFNAILLGLETSRPVMRVAGDLILVLDTACLAVFVTEIILKLIRLSLAVLPQGLEQFRLLHCRDLARARCRRVFGAAGPAHPAAAARRLGRAQPAPGRRRIRHRPARHGIGVHPDDVDLLYRRGDGHEAIRARAFQNGSARSAARAIRCSRS